MINIKSDEFQRVCKLAKLVEVTASKTFAFKNLSQTEGIKLINGKISLFKIITMKDSTKEKVISEAVDSPQIQSVIGAFVKDVRSIEEDIKQRIEKQELKKEEITKEIVINPLNVIPEILEEKRIITPTDIEAWKKLSTFERILLFQKTSNKIVKKRRGFLLPEFAGKDKKTLTDDNYKMFSYIPSNTMKQSANIAFLFQWSAVVESEKYFDDEICLRGYFQVEIDGKQYRKPCGGSCKKKGMMDWGDTMEGAISEMEKRGIYNFLHGDVKRGEFDES